jgi:hypothetical protein
MIKTYEEELAGRAALLVHSDPSSPHAEACVAAAGSLAMAGIEAGHQMIWHNLNQGRRLLLPPFADTSNLLEELARFKTTEDQLNPKTLKTVIDSVRPRVAIHFVVTSLTPLIEKQINDLIARDKLVVLHLPRGREPKIDCTIQHYEA